MELKHEKKAIIGAGLLTGAAAVLLTALGNPANMGFCIACFIRDTAGSLGLHRAEAVQYIRPEIIGLVLGAFFMAAGRKEFSVRGGSSVITRFVLGFFVMIGGLVFLGCPFRMVLRLAGGDLNAVAGLAGFAAGIGCGVFFLNRGYSLNRTYRQTPADGLLFPAIQVTMLVLLAVSPAFLFFTQPGEGPGASHAPVLVSLAAGLAVGAAAQLTRLCMVGGIRDMILFRENKLLLGFIAMFAAALIGNLVLGMFSPGMEGQPIAHTDGLWNFLGMMITGFGSVLLGGCPMRQLVLAGEGNVDSAVTVLGLFAGAAFAHNFGLAASAKGVPATGQAAVLIGLTVMAVLAFVNTFAKRRK